MCVKIANSISEVKYDSKKPLEEQLNGYNKVIIKYESKDPDIDKFLEEMERCCKTGVCLNIDVDMSHGNNLKGMRAKRQAKRLVKDLNLNEAIKLLVNMHSQADRTLKEMSDFCLNGKNNE